MKEFGNANHYKVLYSALRFCLPARTKPTQQTILGRKIMKIPFPAITPPPQNTAVEPVSLPAVTEKELSLKFRAGCLALYLVETLGEWTRRRFERIMNEDIWRDWLHHVDLPQPVQPISEEDLVQMRELRAAIYAVVQAVRRGDIPPSAELACINGWAGKAPPPVALDSQGTGLDPYTRVTQHQVLALIARDAVTLLSGPLRDRIRECASTQCPVLFVDRSRRGDRIWCSASCGARLATARYRHRHASSSHC